MRVAYDFGPDDVRRLRQLLAVTQRDAATRFGVTLNTWSRWELGRLRVHRARVGLLKQVLAGLEREHALQEEAKRAAEQIQLESQARANAIAARRAQEELQARRSEELQRGKQLDNTRRRYRIAVLRGEQIQHNLARDDITPRERNELLADFANCLDEEAAALEELAANGDRLDDISGHSLLHMHASHINALRLRHQLSFTRGQQIWRSVETGLELLRSLPVGDLRFLYEWWSRHPSRPEVHQYQEDSREVFALSLHLASI